jgi:membrane protease YdiL (CAAX protease family)
MSTPPDFPDPVPAEPPALMAETPKPLGPRLGLALLVCAIYYVVVIGVSIVTVIALMAAKAPMDGMLLTLMGQLIGWPLVFWLGVVFTRRTWEESYAVKGFPLRLLPALLVASFGGAFVMNGLASLIPMPQAVRQAFENMTQGNPYILFAAVVVAAPITEELFFRGWMLRGFLDNYSRRKAIWLTAIIFAAFHLNPWQGSACLPLGLALGWLVVRTGSIMPGIFVHFVVNFTAIYLLGPIAVLMGHDVENLKKAEYLPWDVLAGGAVICVAGMVWVWRAVQPRREYLMVGETAG